MNNIVTVIHKGIGMDEYLELCRRFGEDPITGSVNISEHAERLIEHDLADQQERNESE